MKKLIIKLLGLNTLVSELNTLKNEVLVLADENKELKKCLADLEVVVANTECKVNDLEEFDSSQFVSEDDVNDRIESYLNDNDYATTSYVDDEIESKVSDAIDDADIDSKIESAIEDLDIEEKVRDLFNDASPAPMSEEAIKEEVSKAIAEVLSKAYDHLKKQG